MQLFSHSHNNVPQEAEQIVFAVVHFLYLSGEKGPKKTFSRHMQECANGLFLSNHVLYALIATNLHPKFVICAQMRI